MRQSADMTFPTPTTAAVAATAADPDRRRWLLACAVATFVAGCASTGGSGRPPKASEDEAQSAAVYALGLVGTPYRWGGNTPGGGFDCSGLIHHVYLKTAQVSTPRTVAAMQADLPGADVDDLRTGDVVLFGRGSTATHAGVFVGNGRFVHAPSTGGTVRLDRLDRGYWAPRLMGVRRP